MQEDGNFKVERIEQPDTWSCFACCAAMVTGETLQDVRDFLGHDGSHELEESSHPEKRAGFAYSEILRYLADQGWSLGSFCYFGTDGKHFNDVDMDGERRFRVLTPFSPGMLVVASRVFPGGKHIIVWDGKDLWDPSPSAPGPRELDEYVYFEFWPLCDFRDKVWKRWKGLPT
jgi:hypothetical protein